MRFEAQTPSAGLPAATRSSGVSMPWSTALRSRWPSGASSFSRMSRSTCVACADDLEANLLAERAADVAHHARETERCRRRTGASGRRAPDRRAGGQAGWNGDRRFRAPQVRAARKFWLSAMLALELGNQRLSDARPGVLSASCIAKACRARWPSPAAAASACEANRRTASASAIRQASRRRGQADG